MKPSLTDELLLSPTTAEEEVQPSVTIEEVEETPSFEELDSAASDLNEALSGARAKLDELRQATELAAMAAELREELESSIQENNRLAASLAEVQSERSDLETQNNEAQRQISELTETVERSKLEIAEQADQLKRRQDKIEEVATARGNAEEQVRQLELELADTGDEVDKLRNEIGELTGQLEATRTELAEANSNADVARQARKDADGELSKVKKQIAGMLRSVLLGGEPIDVSELEDEDDTISEANNYGLGVRYEAIRASNVRAAPDPDSERVGFAKRGDLITVLSKVDGRNWYQIETIDGIRGFIFGDLIRPGA
ncbi:MAG: SH3 domain-containing protein [Alphaproteobacteria bacterium]|nr:SH3 domain-containing protein [Alphaproteobacteria bacterium]